MDPLTATHGVICPRCAATATADTGSTLAESALASLIDVLLHSIFALCTTHHGQQLDAISKSHPPIPLAAK